MRFPARLVAGAVAVLLLTVAVLVVAAERWLRADLEEEVRHHLERQAMVLREALPGDPAEWSGFTVRFGKAGDVRLTLMDKGGRVRADSDIPPGELAQVENHAARPEMAEALRGGVGHAKRHSVTIGSDLMYVAVPGGPGVVRVAMPLTQVDAVVSRANRSVLGAALLALLLGVVLAWAAGRAVTRPLHEMAEAARSIAAGGTPRFPHSGIPDIDEVVAALRRMHEELESRFEALRRQQAESGTLVNAMVEGVLAADQRGRVVTANPAARRLLGFGPGEPLPELQALFHQKEARAVVEAVLAGTTSPDREVLLDERTCLLSARPLPGGGAVLVLHDVTELRRLETVRRDFVANVSHELKTPLTSISGYAETLLAEPGQSETARRFLETILANAHRMQDLVDDQLDLSRIESGSWRPSPRTVATEAALREAWEELALPDRAAHRFEAEVAAGAESMTVDPDALRTLLRNLYDNARRYTLPGGRITALAVPEAGGVRVSVRDTGSGIAGEHLPRIFERFYRADPGRSRAEGGTGLGLAIVKHLVESHGGRAWAESTLREGTTIHCWFPTPAQA